MSSVLIRPRIDWKKAIIRASVGLLIAVVIGITAGWVSDKLGIRNVLNDKLVFICYWYMWNISSLEARVAGIIITLEVFIFIKPIAIWFVRLYQRYAPASTRQSCLFEPSCSNYMIMAIEKYGFYRGVIKGLKRLKRCHQPNGGIDYP